MGPSRDPFRVFEDPAAQDDELVEDDEGSDDEPGPEANIGVRTTPESPYAVGPHRGRGLAEPGRQ